MLVLSITNFCEEHLVSAVDCVQDMRDIVHKETGLTISAGIAPNKVRIPGDRPRLCLLIR
jgi:DNA polymerase kappa